MPRRADAAEVVGAALVAKADGRGWRRIAAELDRPPATVRRWLRAARGAHLAWLRRRGVRTAAMLAPEVLADLDPQPTALARRAGRARRGSDRLAAPLRPTRRGVDPGRRVHRGAAAYPDLIIEPPSGAPVCPSPTTPVTAHAGETLLVHGAAGGVGSATVQLGRDLVSGQRVRSAAPPIGSMRITSAPS